MEVPEQFNFYTHRIDAANFERIVLVKPNENPCQIRIEQHGVYAGGIAADGVVSFDWPVLQAMADSDSKDMAHAVARLLIAPREEGRKETP